VCHSEGDVEVGKSNESLFSGIDKIFGHVIKNLLGSKKIQAAPY
jgi:hypothetical protein